MTIASAWKPAGIALFAAASAAGTARAEDQVKPGNWEFHVETANAQHAKAAARHAASAGMLSQNGIRQPHCRKSSPAIALPISTAM